jgi:sortase B
MKFFRLFTFIFTVFTLILLSACGSPKPDPFSDASAAVKNGTPPDFASLQALNPDVIAWLTIPGTEISEPILRREGEDSFYQIHAPDGKTAGTAVFSQSAYNSADMNDPITVLYGSNQRQFANLQHRYTENGSLEQFGTVIVYTPTETLSYRVFGAGAFTDAHLLHTYKDDSSTLIRDWFRYHVMSRQYDGTTSLPDGAKLLVLSTHAREDDDQRFLILATTA